MMGRRGPQPVPTKKLALRGSWRAKVNPREPKPEPVAPDCPEWLDEAARDCWQQLVPMLEAMGVVAKVDGNILARYCRLWARWKQCELFIQEHGQTFPTKDEHGNVTGLAEWPQVGRSISLGQQLERIEDRFGMNPAARTRITVGGGSGEKEKQKDAKARFFKVG